MDRGRQGTVASELPTIGDMSNVTSQQKRGCDNAKVKQRSITLRPFEDQVGGMTRMFKIDDSTICKACLKREFAFYCTMPRTLAPFTSEVRAIIEVKMVTNESGESVLRGFPTEVTPKAFLDDVVSKGEYLESSLDPVLCLRQKLSQYKRSYLQELEQIQVVLEQHGQLNYMAFDNVLTGFHRPSVIDLKVGLRHYGDDHAVEDIVWKKDKYNGTTSRSLGLRNCGSKVYNRLTDSFTLFNKYQTFNYNIQQFSDSLLEFLHDGFDFRYDVISVLLLKVRALRGIIATLDGFRFYAVSLLLVYDAGTSMLVPEVTPETAQLHKNDSFGPKMPHTKDTLNVTANTPQYSCYREINGYNNEHISEYTNVLDTNMAVTCQGVLDKNVFFTFENGSTLSSTKSENCDISKATDESLLQNSLSVSFSNTETIPPRDNGDNSDNGSKIITQNKNTATSCLTNGDNPNINRSDTVFGSASFPNATMVTGNYNNTRKPSVDIRIIDFAHATHSQFPGGTVTHSGPHRGFLFGLDNLIRILCELQK